MPEILLPTASIVIISVVVTTAWYSSCLSSVWPFTARERGHLLARARALSREVQVFWTLRGKPRGARRVRRAGDATGSEETPRSLQGWRNGASQRQLSALWCSTRSARVSTWATAAATAVLVQCWPAELS